MRSGLHGQTSRRAGIAVLALLALVPLIYVPGTMYPYVTPRALYLRFLVATGVAVLLWIAGTRRVELSDRRDPVLWSLVAFVLLSAVSGLLGASPHQSFFGDYERMWGVLQWLYLLLYYVLLRSILGREEWTLYLRAAVYVAGGVAAYAAIQWLVSGDLSTASTLGNRGYLGAYMILSGGAATALADREEDGIPPWLLISVLIAFAGIVVLTGRRAALLGGALGVGAAIALLVGSGGSRLGIPKRWLLGAVTVVAAAAGATHFLSPETLLRVPAIARLGEIDLSGGTLAARFLTWEAGLDGLAARPVTGWGAENFHLVFDRFTDPSIYSLRPEHTLWDRAHNVLIGKLVQTGPVGFVAYLAFWASLFGLTVRGRWTGRLRPLEAASLLAAFTGYFVFLQFWFEDHSSALLLITLAAYLRHRYGRNLLVHVERREAVPKHRAVLLGFACVIIVGGALWIDGRSALAARRMYQGREASGLATTVRRYEQARRLDVPEQRQVARQYASSMSNLGLRAGQRLRGSDSLRALYSRGVEGSDRALELAAARSPRDGRLDAWRGRLASGAAVVFADDGIRRLARQSLGHAIEKSPPLIEHRHTLASVEALFGNLPAARRSLRSALEVYDGYGRTYYLMGRMASGRVDSVVLGLLRKSFWLGYFPEVDDAGFLRGTLEELMRRGRARSAERLVSVYFASRYLPALRKSGDPFADERRAFFGNLSADVARPGRSYRSYRISQQDLAFLARWPRVALAAGECRRATLAMRLLMNGLSEGRGTAILMPTLSRQLTELQRRCEGS